MTYRLILFMACASLALAQAGCMKTRSQIKGDQAENASDDEKSEPPRNPALEMEEVKNELTRLSGKIDELDHAQKSHNYGELKEYTVRLDGRVSELEKNQLLIMSELKELKTKDEASAKAAATPSPDLLAQGNKLLAVKKYDEAAEKYKAVLSKGSKGKEAADASFGLGECEYGQKNYKKAIVQYSKVQEANPKSGRVPASLYKIGLSFQHLNMPKEANGFFAELVERYPKSSEAKKARAKVKE